MFHAIPNKNYLVLETPSKPYPIQWSGKKNFFADLDIQCNSKKNFLGKLDPFPNVPERGMGSTHIFSVQIWSLHEIHSIKKCFAMSPPPYLHRAGVGNIHFFLFRSGLLMEFLTKHFWIFSHSTTPSHPKGMGLHTWVLCGIRIYHVISSKKYFVLDPHLHPHRGGSWEHDFCAGFDM